MTGGYRVGVDVGGTFTDLVALGADGVRTAKVLSTPHDQAEGVTAALAAAGLDQPGKIDGFAHGTTVATNALLERRGARTALVTTAGFRDVIEIARQDRPSLYDLTEDRPPPLVPRERRFTVVERMGPDGVVTPLDEASVAQAVEACRDAAVESVAVCLLFGYLHPAHERAVGEALRAGLDGVSVVLSSEVLPEFREYERLATTVADAYLMPVLGRYLRSLAARLAALNIDDAVVMQSAGGVAGIDEAAERAAALAVSGPAGGVVGAARVAGAEGHDDVVTFDMGGTSTDVALVASGRIVTTTGSEVAGVPIRLPTVDLHTVSAGGGSIAWVDDGGALRVGPRSAGAEPGPAAYGRGGEEPTVTDADLVLGRLADGARLGGAVTLDGDRAHAALAGLGRSLDLDAVEAAAGVVRVADAEMAAALRVITVARGLDPRRFSLVAFGGAGPVHACDLAEDLGMSTVLVPGLAGVLSAYGLAVADRRRDEVAPLRSTLAELDPAHLDDRFASLERAAARDLDVPTLTRRADLRYRRQSYELTVEADGAGPAELAERFHGRHERQLGYRMDEEPVELIAIRVTASVAVDATAAGGERGGGPSSPATSRPVWFGDGWRDTPVIVGDGLGRDGRVDGPAVVALEDTTVVIAPGWVAEARGSGTLVLERDRS
jgi:N-methylhydantoinase A